MALRRKFWCPESGRIRDGFLLLVSGCLLSFFIAYGMHDERDSPFVSPGENPVISAAGIVAQTEGPDSVDRTTNSSPSQSASKEQVKAEADIGKAETPGCLAAIPNYQDNEAKKETFPYAEYQIHEPFGTGTRNIGEFIDVDNEQVASLIPASVDNWHNLGEPIDAHGELYDYEMSDIRDIGLFLDVDAGHAYIAEAIGIAQEHDIGDFIDADADDATWDAEEIDRVEIGRFVDADLPVSGSAASSFLREFR